MAFSNSVKVTPAIVIAHGLFEEAKTLALRDACIPTQKATTTDSMPSRAK
jgi:hypothetical protein